MTTFHAKTWTRLGLALTLSAGLAACGGEGGEPGATAEGGEGGAERGASAPVGEGGEGGAEGGAAGEAGAQAAYAAVAPESRQALRIAHLKGFFLVAKESARVEGPEAAAALVGQGLLEVYDPQKARFEGVDEAVLRRAAETGAPTDLDAAIRALDQAQQRAGGSGAEVAKGMTSIAAGLYRHVVQANAVDPVEYQHAYGAALAARDAAKGAEAAPARADIERFVALWPSVTAPEQPSAATPYSQVQAQASRIELALAE
ncbi:hypothetical protein Q0812_07800 [Brevundimonas sp. 2R-24]|uniref:Lipoprotein n=1 Tax=Peiella sedimenti TaxID=3061083 RepID=A0ABT8SLH2_9CAUL|nr:hypothetical protein [Caulobacteraceae bacterium XZ-24]